MSVILLPTRYCLLKEHTNTQEEKLLSYIDTTFAVF